MIDYEKINLLELRIHARNIGVRRPTCLKKEQLINERKNFVVRAEKQKNRRVFWAFRKKFSGT